MSSAWRRGRFCSVGADRVDVIRSCRGAGKKDEELAGTLENLRRSRFLCSLSCCAPTQTHTKPLVCHVQLIDCARKFIEWQECCIVSLACVALTWSVHAQSEKSRCRDESAGKSIRTKILHRARWTCYVSKMKMKMKMQILDEDFFDKNGPDQRVEMRTGWQLLETQ